MSTTLNAALREKVGTRAARVLREAGRIPATVQGSGHRPHLDLSIDEVEFMTSRRHHQHLYELQIGDAVETVLVNQLGWDVFGERISHVEFRRVDRHQKTDVRVPIEYLGLPKSGVLVHLVTELSLRTTPDNIPNSVVAKINDLEPGAVVTAAQVLLPAGVELSKDVPPDTLIARVAVPKIEVPEVEPAAEAPAAEAAPAVEKQAEPAGDRPTTGPRA